MKLFSDLFKNVAPAHSTATTVSRPTFGNPFGGTPQPIFGTKTSEKESQNIFAEPSAKKSNLNAPSGNIFGGKLVKSFESEDQKKVSNIFGEPSAKKSSLEPHSSSNIFGRKSSNVLPDARIFAKADSSSVVPLFGKSGMGY